MKRKLLFPFSAIVALDKLKLAMLINAINPKIGGLLIRGPKGSGKTTAVRALADILPKIDVVKDCPFNCSPYDPSNMCSKCSERYWNKEKLPVEKREMRVVDLPLGATEDRVVGSLDVEKAIKLGIEALEPGILAEANQNILYVDEINLLPDHIADDLLDAAATGWNVVEREGISVSHPSRFIFIGTMNPEEGELRPQLLDRFPLSVAVERINSVKDRMEVVKRNMEFEADPEKFCEKYRSVQEEIRRRIAQARKILPKVKMPEKLLEVICRSCLELKVDGMRPDIVISKAACTLAAFENRTTVTLNDVLVASELALSHRTREGGFVEPATPEEITKVFLAKAKELKYVEETGHAESEEEEKKKGRTKLKTRTMVFAWSEATKKEEKSKKGFMQKLHEKRFKALFKLTRLFGGIVWIFGKRLKKAPENAPIAERSITKGSETLKGKTRKEKPKKGIFKGIPAISSASRMGPKIKEGTPFLTKIRESLLAPFHLSFKVKKTGKKIISSHAGKRAEAVTTLHRGRACGWRLPQGRPRDIHLPATIRAAARKQKSREKPVETAIEICIEDVREKLRRYRAPMTIVFVIDLSGSMLLNIDSVKEAMLKLHRDAYRHRDRVGIVALKDVGAVVVQHPITNLRVVANKMMNLRISGFTPLAAGMRKAWEVLKEAKRRDASTIPVMAIITDGSANVPLKRSLETGEIRNFDEIGIATRQFEDLAIHDVISVSKMIRRERIHTIVVNTNPRLYGRETYGLWVTSKIAALTGGTHHALGRIREPSELVESIVDRIAEDRRLISHNILFSERSMQRYD